MKLTDKFANAIIDCEKNLIQAEYVINVLVFSTGNYRLLLKALENLHKSAVLVISNILKYEHLYCRLKLVKNSERNLEIFFEKGHLRYGLSEDEILYLKELFLMAKKHRNSGFEFSGKDKAVIMGDDLSLYEINCEKLKKYALIIKKVIKNFRKEFAISTRKI